VMSATESIPNGNNYDSVFKNRNAPGPIVHHKWALHPTVPQLAYDFVRSVAYFVDRRPEPPDSVRNLCELIVARWSTLVSLLSAGQLIAEGMFENTGIVQDIPSLEWDRPNMKLDLRSSDLIELSGNVQRVRWSGVSLRLPGAARLNRFSKSNQGRTKQNRTDSDQTCLPPLQASVIAAVKALWPDGIPAQLMAKSRDNMINQWQREKGLPATSQKTISRALKAYQLSNPV
jgi:hypothetical protein